MKGYLSIGLLGVLFAGSALAIPSTCAEQYQRAGAIPGEVDCRFRAAASSGGLGSYYCTGSSGLDYIREYCGDWWDECEGPNNQSNSILGNPINIATGHKLQQVTDYKDESHGTFNFPLVHKRYYNSNYRITAGVFGPAWRGHYERTIQVLSDSSLRMVRHVGGNRSFTKSGEVWQSSSFDANKLEELKDGSGTRTGWRYTSTDLDVELYDVDGRLVSITNRHGLTHTLEYQSGRLFRVYDSANRYIGFVYHPDGLVSELKTPDNASVFYEYQDFNYTSSTQKKRLYRVKQPDLTPADSSDNPFVEYRYGEAAYTNSSYAGLYLTGIIDENGDRYATYGYDSAGRANLTVHGTHDEDSTEGEKDNANRMDVIYSVSDTSYSATSINAKGKQTIYSFQLTDQLRRATNVEGVASPNCAAANRGKTLDVNGFPDTVTDWNGNVTDYTYSSVGLETSRTEALGQAEERSIETDWYVDQRLPEEIREEGRTINFTYENGRLKSRIETDTTNFSQPYSTNGRQRSWDYSYTYHDPQNRLVETVTVDGPRSDVNDVTVYQYNESGWLISVTNALGHKTEVLEYNLKGQPLRVRDANGVETSLTYHPRGWLETRTLHSNQGDLTTSYEYDDAGMVTGVNTADGKSITLQYDTAHRLTKVTNNLGETLELTLDEFGKPKVTEVRDSQNNIQKLVRKEFDELGRLWKVIAVEGHDQEIYQYDNNSNPTRIYDANDVPRMQAFDGLDRLDVITDREGGVVDYDYDARDNLVSVSDKNQLHTLYTVDGFGFKLQEQSPDRGTIVYQYDPVGNLTEKRDARQVTSTYTYDPINRVKTHDISGYPDEAITYSYDEAGSAEEPNYGIGKLTGISQASGDSESYVYDDRGNKTIRTAVVNGQTYITGFVYNDKNQLATITYPSGRLVHYTYNDLGRINSVTTQQSSATDIEPVAANVLYAPFGPLSALDYGNGIQLTKSYDKHYRIDRITSAVSDNAVLDLDYGYDTRGNINSIEDLLDSSKSQIFTADAISRLIAATGGYGDFAYDYDPNGNREQVTWEQGASNYVETYSTNSSINNRLLSTTRSGTDNQSKSYDYSDSGNMTQSGNLTFDYDGRDRMIRAYDSGTLIAEYRHNALHQRTVKTIVGDAEASKHFHYSLSGTLLGENRPDGSMPKDYIYIENMLIAIADDQDDTVLNETDISVAITGDDGKFQPDKDAGDGKVAFIFNVTNTNNTVTARDVTSTVAYPSGITFESITPSSGSCDSDGVSCSLGDIEPGHTVSVRIVISQPEPKERTYTVDVAAATDEPNLSNNTATGNYGGDCFIATAAFGSYAHPYLHILRDFRDQSLLTNAPGQWFVKTYYELSPPMANWIAHRDEVKSIVRVLLLPLIGFAWLADMTTGFGALVVLLALPSYILVRRFVSVALDIDIPFRSHLGFLSGSAVFSYSKGKLSLLAVVVILMLLNSGQSWAGLYYVHSDHGNKPAVITNKSQQMVWSNYQTPSGKRIIVTSSFENNIGYQGQYFDVETDMDYNIMRSYSADIGAYIQADPIGVGADLNVYRYARNNPLLYVDPLGLWAICEVIKIYAPETEVTIDKVTELLWRYETVVSRVGGVNFGIGVPNPSDPRLDPSLGLTIHLWLVEFSKWKEDVYEVSTTTRTMREKCTFDEEECEGVPNVYFQNVTETLNQVRTLISSRTFEESRDKKRLTPDGGLIY